MTISFRRRLANRRNARKSTGPKTPEGKAVSRYNAVKHGLYFSEPVIISRQWQEDSGDYHRLRDIIRESLNPADDFQKVIVRQIVDCFWLCRRYADARERFCLPARVLLYWERRLFKKIRNLTDLIYFLQEIPGHENENNDSQKFAKTNPTHGT